jgi:hypothetical protein
MEEGKPVAREDSNVFEVILKKFRNFERMP